MDNGEELRGQTEFKNYRKEGESVRQESQQ